MNARTRRLGGASTAILAALAAAAFIGAAATSVYSSAGSAAGTVDPGDDPQLNQKTERYLALVGLDPTTTCAAGVTDTQIATLVAAGKDHVRDNIAALDLAEQSLYEAEADVARLTRKLRAGTITTAERAELTTAEAQVSLHAASLDAGLEGLFDAAADGLSPAVIARIETMHANRDRATDPAMRAFDRADADWVNLRYAANHERLCLAAGEPVDADAAALLENARDAAEVSDAAARLGGLAAFTSAYKLALDD